jgi:hypothetical protein
LPLTSQGLLFELFLLDAVCADDGRSGSPDEAINVPDLASAAAIDAWPEIPDEVDLDRSFLPRLPLFFFSFLLILLRLDLDGSRTACAVAGEVDLPASRLTMDPDRL